MKRYYFAIIGSLLASLYIYVVYRTDKTVINIIVDNLLENRLDKAELRSVQLPENFIYSLPEGLWVFAATLLSKHLHISIRKAKIDMVYLPLGYALLLEIFQLFSLTPGRFDMVDILLSILFWLLGLVMIKCPHRPQPLQRLNYRSMEVIFSYCIVFLAHVNR